MSPCSSYSLLAVLRFDHLVSRARQKVAQDLQIICLIFDNQNAFCHARLACCALAARGHAAAAPPRRVMNSRLLSRMASLLLNHFVGKNLDLLRDCEPERVRDLEVENELKSCRCLDRQLAGLGPLQDTVNIFGCAPPKIR